MINFVSIGAVIADIVLICLFILSVSIAYRRGFTILVFNLICTAITVIAVIALCKPVTNLIYENTKMDEFFSRGIQNAIGGFLEEQIEKNGHINTGKTNIARPVADKINSYIDEVEDESISVISKHVSDKLSYIAISAIVVIVLFVVIRLSTILLRFFLYFITNLPIIKSLDKVGGVAYGILRAYLIAYLVLAILSLLSPILANTGIIACINNSILCEKLYNNNIFLNILL